MARDPGTLAGELGLISLFDIGQLLLLNRATGVMSVTSEGRRGSLWFRDGQLVNAIDEKQRDGEDAAFAVFAWRRGRFEFHGGPLPGVATIEGGTEAIMLEAARRIDEAGTESGSESVGSETAKLVEHQSKFDLLREEFTRVTRDASSAARGTPASRTRGSTRCNRPATGCCCERERSRASIPAARGGRSMVSKRRSTKPTTARSRRACSLWDLGRGERGPSCPPPARRRRHSRRGSRIADGR